MIKRVGKKNIPERSFSDLGFVCNDVHKSMYQIFNRFKGHVPVYLLNLNLERDRHKIAQKQKGKRVRLAALHFMMQNC